MEPTVQTPFGPTPSPDLPSMNGQEPKKTHPIAIAFVAFVALAAIIGIVWFVRRSRQIKTIAPATPSSTATSTQVVGRILSATDDAPVTSTSSALIVLPPPADTTMIAATGTLAGRIFSIQIPLTYQLITDQTDRYQIVSRSDNEPVMNFSLQKKTTLTRVMRDIQSKAPTGKQAWLNTQIDNRQGRVLRLENKAYPDLNVAYVFRNGRDALSFTLWSFTPWDAFDNTVKSFTWE